MIQNGGSLNKSIFPDNLCRQRIWY